MANMTRGVKAHVCSRISEYLQNYVNTSFNILPRHIEIGTLSEEGNVQLILRPNEIVDKSLAHNELPNLDRIETDNIIKSVHKVANRNKIFWIFCVAKDIFVKDVLENAVNKPASFRKRHGYGLKDNGSKVVVEFSSPNIAKPFHLGHLRSTIIGNYISKLHEYFTVDVTKLNYLGDWGTQFGLLNVGVDLLKYSDDMLQENPIQYLYEAYVAANKTAETNSDLLPEARKVFQELEDGNCKYLERWQKYREYSISDLEKTYARLGVSFTKYYWESMYGAKEVDVVLEKLKENMILQLKDDGRHVVDIDEKRTVTVLKSDGSTVYLTRDIAAAIDRYESYKFDKMYYVVENGQSDHLSSLFKILQKLGYSWANDLHHVKFGRVRGMSTRRGNVVFLRDILDEARVIMQQKQDCSPTTKLDLPENTADILGLSAVIVNDLKQRRLKDYEFDWSKVLQVEGDTGIKIQYTHCRLWNLEKNSGARLALSCDPAILCEDNATALALEIARFDDIIIKSFNLLEPCILVNYLFHLCHAINRANKVLQIKGQDSHVASQRLMLFHASRLTLNQGMRILGLMPLCEM